MRGYTIEPQFFTQNEAIYIVKRFFKINKRSKHISIWLPINEGAVCFDTFSDNEPPLSHNAP